MSLYITSLNSGSNGNCYYVGNNQEAVLIDAGISCRETEKRMARLGLDMEKVKAIFVSHEHGDHITGIPALSKKYQLPVYANATTFKQAAIPVEEHLVRHFSVNESIQIGQISVKPFSKKHDAVDPTSFVVSHQETHVGVFTDIGVVCQETEQHFKQCHAVFLEANYDAAMLMEGNYPYHLKQRITSGLGHLSNAQALELYLNHKPKHLSHLILSHLSKNNNSPQLVQELFNKHAGNTAIIVASRYEETPVFCIGHKITVTPALKRRSRRHEMQLSMF